MFCFPQCYLRLLKQLTFGTGLDSGKVPSFGEFDPATAPVCPAMPATRTPVVHEPLDTHTGICFEESFSSPALFTRGTNYLRNRYIAFFEPLTNRTAREKRATNFES